MKSISIAAILDQNEREVGEVIAAFDFTTYVVTVSVHLQGSRGKAITDILNSAYIFTASVGPQEHIWIRPRECPEHTGPVSLERVVKAISGDELLLKPKPEGIERADDTELEMRIKQPHDQRKYISSQEFLAMLAALPPPLTSDLEKVVEEYEEHGRSSAGAVAWNQWLQRFSDALR